MALTDIYFDMLNDMKYYGHMTCNSNNIVKYSDFFFSSFFLGERFNCKKWILKDYKEKIN